MFHIELLEKERFHIEVPYHQKGSVTMETKNEAVQSCDLKTNKQIHSTTPAQLNSVDCLKRNGLVENNKDK